MDNNNLKENNEQVIEQQNQGLPSKDFTDFDSVPKYDTEVYDDGDIASAIEMDFIAKALENHKKNNLPETHPDFDGEHCIDCDVKIIKERLKLGKIRCVDCQEYLEKMNKRNSR